MGFTHDDIMSLGAKLAALELSDGERSALRTMAAAAIDLSERVNAGEEVAPFAFDPEGIQSPESLVDIAAWRRLSSMLIEPDDQPDDSPSD